MIVTAMPRESRDAFREKWESILHDTQTKLHAAILAGDMQSVKVLAIAAGIGTDKVLTLAGLPTQIIQGLDAHRPDLPELLERLAKIAREPA